jgi:hypothetical protein
VQSFSARRQEVSPPALLERRRTQRVAPAARNSAVTGAEGLFWSKQAQNTASKYISDISII